MRLVLRSVFFVWGAPRADLPLASLPPPPPSRPTRYALDLESLKGSVTVETFKEPSQREDSKKAIKQIFEERCVPLVLCTPRAASQVLTCRPFLLVFAPPPCPFFSYTSGKNRWFFESLRF